MEPFKYIPFAKVPPTPLINVEYSLQHLILFLANIVQGGGRGGGLPGVGIFEYSEKKRSSVPTVLRPIEVSSMNDNTNVHC